ncbi:hypothetical protein ACWGJZ_34260, partial [Streptomyces rimosus]
MTERNEPTNEPAGDQDDASGPAHTTGTGTDTAAGPARPGGRPGPHGEPRAAGRGVVPVPEKDLPVVLPEALVTD